MKKTHTYFALFFLVFLACIPPIEFYVTNPTGEWWFVMALIAAFFGIFTLFLKTDWPVKAIAVSSLVLCFLSTVPYVAFTSYVSIVMCCYFYVLCTRIEDWKLVFKMLQTLLFLNMLLIVFQFLGRDTLLNFGLGKTFTCFGVIGQHMQMGSFSVVLSAVLLPLCVANIFFPFVVAFFCTSAWTFLAAGVGSIIYLCDLRPQVAAIFTVLCLIVFAWYGVSHEKFSANLEAPNGRLEIWGQTCKYALKHPFHGWGPGTYKIVFPGLFERPERYVPYKSAHNAFLQLFFELGIPFTAAVIWGLLSLLRRLWEAKEIRCVMGLSMILIDAQVHFPDRMLQTVGLIICFLAYCQVRLKKHVIDRPIIKA